MAYKVFISYSSKDLSIVKEARKLLTNPLVEVFIAEYSVRAGSVLNNEIIQAIKNCNLFVLLWSRNSKASEYVQQEIGVARGNDKNILPIVLSKRLKLPAFIKELKYLRAYDKPRRSLNWLQKHIFDRAEKQRQKDTLILIGLGALLVWLFSRE